MVDLRTDTNPYLGDAIIVSPDLASRSLLQKFRLEGGFVIHALSVRQTKRIRTGYR